MRGIDVDTGERGAQLVELAIILPLVLLLIFGIIEFGTAYNNKIAINQGAREGARQAVVANFANASCSGTPNEQLACLTKSRVGLDASKTRVYVKVPSYTVGSRISVCVAYPIQSITGIFAPLLSGRVLHGEATMRVEQAPSPGLTTGGDAPLAGDDWSWCG
jgi:Flp pilus assembly protein TadG